MKKHYRVQSVLLSSNKTVAVTMSPVEWVVPDPQAGTDEEGSPLAWVDAEPEDEGAEPYEAGGAKTELRFTTSEQMLLPDEFVTLTIERTTHNWKGSVDDL